jgi:hypothetical protein
MHYYIKILSVLHLFLTFSLSQSLNDNLKILQPLIGNNWVGFLKSPDGKNEWPVERKFISVWNGNAIKIEKSIKDLNNFGEGYIYWDDIEDKTAFFYIENTGVWQEGYIQLQDQSITFEGKITWPSKTYPDIPQEYEFKNIFEFIADTIMVDRWVFYDIGLWKDGHTIEFNIK